MLGSGDGVRAQTTGQGMLGRGHRTLRSAEDLPAGRLQRDLDRLPLPARARALDRLNRFEFPAADHRSLHVDREGGVFYVCTFALPADLAPPVPAEPPASPAPVPVSPFPSSLQFSSRPGSANTLFLDFDGHTVTGTAWNSSLNRSSIPATAFSSDSDYSHYSDAEQAAIRGIWQRVAEDFAPFDLNVTTIEPASFNQRTGRVLITDHLDANGQPNPFENAGGVAYIGVFNSGSYAFYSPAWVYADNLSQREDYMAEAASHEFGHNLNLSHDGKTDGTEYYSGHGTDDTSWGPIMGTGYGRNVSQWSKGEYYLSNNTQDDLFIMQGFLGYRPDDHGNTSATATPLSVQSNDTVTATTPATDPANSNPANKGVLASMGDVDVFSFNALGGPVRLDVTPWISPANTRGGNADLRARLYNSAGQLLAEASPTDRTHARLQTGVDPGVHFLRVSAVGVGDPTSSSPSGYTEYGSRGQYFITGSVAVAAATVRLEGNLAFGAVQIGTTARRMLTLHNDNPQVLTVSGMAMPAGFSGAWTGAVPALSSRDVPILFSPDAAAAFGGDLAVSVTGGGATQTASVSGVGFDGLFLQVTNPPSGTATLAHAVTSYDLKGRAGLDLQGTLRWSNLLTGASGSTAVQSNWSLLVPSLGLGTNAVRLTATNAPFGFVAATDAAGQAPYLDGWSTGDNGGGGWNAWILAAGEANAGHFRATAASNPRLNIGADAWGLWANSGSQANAYRPLGRPLRTGDTLRVSFENNWIETGSTVGMALLNPAGEALMEFFFMGGGSTYTINDAVTGRNTGIPYTDTGLQLAITPTASNAYRLVVGGTTLLGSFMPRADLTPTRFRAWNHSAGPGEDFNAYFNNLSFSNGPALPSTTTVTASLARLPSGASILVSPSGFTSTYLAVTSLAVQAAGEPPLQYEWQKDSVTLAGRTNAVLDFSPVLRSDAGDYVVIVSNPYGAATSAVAVVVVDKASQSIDFPNPGDQLEEDEVTLSASASSGLPVQWQLLSGPAVLSGAVLTFTATGTVAVAASQEGDLNWLAAQPVTNEFLVTAFADTNANGIPDGWELQYFGSLTNVTATSNADGDVHLDREEYITGTDPIDPDSFFRVHIADVLAAGPPQFGLRWVGVSNRIYRVERVLDVISEYEPVSGDLPAQDPTNEYTETPPDSDIFYYRVRVWLAP